jgi:ParB-like chromosome segregation protein Spo0J
MKLYKIKLNPDNPRFIKDDKFEKLVASIKDFPKMMSLRPIIVNKDFMILGGNMRYRALEVAGYKDVPDEWVKIADKLTPDEEKRFIIEDNMELGRWDLEVLGNDWSDFPLKDWGIDFDAWVPQNKTDDPVLEMADVEKLKPNPRKYREHPEDQINHLVQSIKQHGIYRNIVVAKGGVILDGHALVEAAKKSGMKRVPVMRLNIEPDSPEALKILISNNEMTKFAESDDRKLTEILRELKEKNPDGLEGTGFNEMQLANLVMVTRPAGEIGDINEAAEWIGMPEFEAIKNILKVHVSFETEEDRQKFMKSIGATVINKAVGSIWCIWYPEKKRDDINSIEFK